MPALRRHSQHIVHIFFVVVQQSPSASSWLLRVIFVHHIGLSQDTRSRGGGEAVYLCLDRRWRDVAALLTSAAGSHRSTPHTGERHVRAGFVQPQWVYLLARPCGRPTGVVFRKPKPGPKRHGGDTGWQHLGLRDGNR